MGCAIAEHQISTVHHQMAEPKEERLRASGLGLRLYDAISGRIVDIGKLDRACSRSSLAGFDALSAPLR